MNGNAIVALIFSGIALVLLAGALRARLREDRWPDGARTHLRIVAIFAIVAAALTWLM